MKKILVYTFIITFIIKVFSLNAVCLEDPKGVILDFQGGEGADSVYVVDNYAYVSLNFIKNDNGNIIKGLAQVDISNPENFISYGKLLKENNYSYSVDQYISDISSIAKIFYYGNDFLFNEQLTEPPDSYIIYANKNSNNDTILYGYSNSAFGDNMSFIWEFNPSTKEFKYIKIPDSFVVNAVFKSNYLFILTESVYDRNMYEVLAVPLTEIDNNIDFSKFIIYDYFSNWTPDNQLPLTNFYIYSDDSINILDLMIFQSYNIKDDNGNIIGEKTDLELINFIDNGSSLNLETTSTISIPYLFDKILYYSCNYLIVGNFDKIKILEKDNESFKKISEITVWEETKSIFNNNILYVANMGANVNAIDVSNPYSPYIIDNTTIWAATRDLFLKDNLLYVAHGWSGLAVYNADTCTPSTTSNFYTECFSTEDNTTDSTDNTSTAQCDSVCFTSDDVNQVTATWYLAGTGCDITDMNIFNNVKSVWLWDSNTWKIYSPLPEINAVLQNYHIGILTYIPAKRGFWINIQ